MSFKVDYTDKYLKYKKKYLSLKNMIGGGNPDKFQPMGDSLGWKSKKQEMSANDKKISELTRDLDILRSNKLEYIEKEILNEFMEKERNLTAKILALTPRVSKSKKVEEQEFETP